MISRLLFVLLLSVIATYSQDTVLVNVDTLSLEGQHVLGYYNYEMPTSLYVSNYDGNVEKPENKSIDKDSFYPIGWSPNGYFAYLVHVDAENCNCYFVEVYIQNLKTNKVEWFMHYDNEEYVHAWDVATKDQKDSLRDLHVCYYLKCFWYTNYDTLQKSFYEYGIQPLADRARRRELEDDEKYSYIHIDTLEDEIVANVDLFFRYETDTFKFKFEIDSMVSGVNYHGYLPNEGISDYDIALLSERHLGIDTSENENWHYRLFGFKRDLTIPFEKMDLDEPPTGYFLISDTLETSYRPVQLVEQMHDRVTSINLERWLDEFSRYLDVNYRQKPVRTGLAYAQRPPNLKDLFKIDGDTYHMDRAFERDEMQYIIYSGSEDGFVENGNHLIAYNRDSGEVDFWYDLSFLEEASPGGVLWVEKSDSLIFVAYGNDSIGEGNNYGKVLCIDTKRHEVVWQSESKCGNSESFVLLNDIIIAGYAGDDEDGLVLLNRKNGKELKRIRLLWHPLWIVYKDDRIHVSTERSDHEFKIESSFFEVEN